MTKHDKARFAGAAIAAALVLGTTPAWSQDATAPAADLPPLVLPPVAETTSATTATTATPPIGAPAEPAASEPVAAAAPRAVRSAAPAPRQASAPASTRVVAPAVPIAASVAPTTAPAEVAPEVTEPAASEIASQPAPAVNDSAPTRDGNDLSDELLLGGGLLAALGLAGFGIAARRRRRIGVESRNPLEIAHVEPTSATPQPALVTAPAPAARTVAPQWTSAAAFTLPATVPSDVNERRMLIDRMVAAQPDAANPFRTRKARMKRARLILATREAQAGRMPQDRTFARPQQTAPVREFEPA